MNITKQGVRDLSRLPAAIPANTPGRRIEVVKRYGSMEAVNHLLCGADGHIWKCGAESVGTDSCVRCGLQDACEHQEAR